jgi:hypothetical protein
MSDRASGEQPFDERAALEELEHVRKEIERYQAQRKTLEEEFDRFTASFKQPIPVSAPTVPPASVPPPSVPPPIVSRPAVWRPTVSPPTVPPPTVPPATLDPSALDEPPVRPQDENPVSAPLAAESAPIAGWHRRVLRSRPASIAGALLLMAGTAYVLWMRKEPEVQPAVTVAQGPKTAAAPQTKAGTAAPPTPAPAQPARHESVITTTRAVWVRVIADGVPVVERELPANTRLPFAAREKIVIRTGNAGAVRLTIGGVDKGALGDYGEVVTRRFDVPR